MLEIKNVSISLIKDNRPLIKDLSFTVSQGDKIAIIGEEGNGKSTLLKYIYNKKLIENYTIYSGTINNNDLIIEYLEQNLSNDWYKYNVMDYFLKRDPDSDTDYDIYNKYIDIEKIMMKLNLKNNLLNNNQTIETLSGGEKVKIQLVKLLLKEPDILLLDEPTNDLDIETLKWLEEFIKKSEIPIVFISHDETLLENCANKIVHLEQIKRKSECRHAVEVMGYYEYCENRYKSLVKQDQIHKLESKDMKEKTRILKEIKEKVRRENPMRNNRMHTLITMEKRYSNTEITEKVDVEEAIKMSFDKVSLPKTKIILNFINKEIFVNEKFLCSNVNLNVTGPEHLVIIGTNGVGKSTLLKEIYKDLKNRNDIKVGYMPQNYEDEMDDNINPIEFLVSNSSKDEETRVRTLMGNLKFTSEEMVNKIKNLSSGQKAKLMLLSLIINEDNVLILDEPTRNLSPLSNHVIRNILSNYSGAIISVSHDRKYIEEVCNSIYELRKDGLFIKDNYFSEKANIADLKTK